MKPIPGSRILFAGRMRTAEQIETCRQGRHRYKDRKNFLRRKLYAENPQNREHRNRDTALYLKYGITQAIYNRLFAGQEGKCACCHTRSDTVLHVDHDHRTGAIRGLLCGPCNRAIGILKESRELCFRAAIYLDNYPASELPDADFFALPVKQRRDQLRHSAVQSEITKEIPCPQLRERICLTFPK